MVVRGPGDIPKIVPPTMQGVTPDDEFLPHPSDQLPPPVLTNPLSDQTGWQQLSEGFTPTIQRTPTYDLGNGLSLQFYKTGATPPGDVLTFMLPKTDAADLVDEETAMKADFEWVSRRSAFIGEVYDGIRYYQGAAKADSYIVIDTETGTVSETSKIKSDPDDPPNLIYARKDPNMLHLLNACHTILQLRQEGKISESDAKRELEELTGEIERFETEKLIERADEQYDKINLLKRKIAELEDIKFKREISIGLREVSKEELFSHSDSFIDESAMREIEILVSQINSLRHELEMEEATLRGLASVVTYQSAMETLAWGIPEDDVLAKAARTMAGYGLEEDALRYAREAKQIADDIGDKISSFQHELAIIEYSRLNPTERQERFETLLKHVEDMRVSHLKGRPVTPIDGAPEWKDALDEIDAGEDIQRTLVTLRADIIETAARFAAEAADDDPDEEVFQRVVFLLNRGIEDAIAAPDTTTEQLRHLITASTLIIDPYIKGAAEEVTEAKLSGRDEYIKSLYKRAKRVEKMFALHMTKNPDDRQNSVIQELMSTFGAYTYVWSNWNTGFAYDAIRLAFGKYAQGYPPSEMMSEIHKMIRGTSGHLFDLKTGRLLPEILHRPAIDGGRATVEVIKRHFMPGGALEYIGTGIPMSVAGAAAYAKLCGMAGAVLGPKGAAAAAGACGIVGAFAGETSAMEVTRLRYKSEIETLAQQARMAGMEAAGIIPGQGDLTIVLTCLTLSLAAILNVPIGRAAARPSPMGRVFFSKDGVFSRRGAKHIGGVLKSEGRKFKRLGQASWHALKGFARLAGRRGDDLAALPLAKRLSTALSLGGEDAAQKASKRLDRLLSMIIERSSKSLSKALQKTTGENLDDLADILISKNPDAPQYIDDLIRLLTRVSKGNVDQRKFADELTKIIGNKGQVIAPKISRFLFANPEKITTRATAISRSLTGPTTAKDVDIAISYATKEALGEYTEGLTELLLSRSEGISRSTGRMVKLFRKVAAGKLDKKGFNRDFVKTYGKDSDYIAQRFGRHMFDNAAGAADTVKRARRLANNLNRAMNRESGIFASKVLTVLKRGEMEGMRGIGRAEIKRMATDLTRYLGFGEAPRVVRLIRMINLEGTRAVQTEALIADMMTDKTAMRALLEEMLTCNTRENVRSAAERSKTRVDRFLEKKLATDGAFDRHLAMGLLTADKKGALLHIVRKMLRRNSRRFTSDDFFAELLKVPGMDNFFGSALAGEAINLGTGSGRIAAINRIFTDDRLCVRFIELVIGKGLKESDKKRIPEVVKDTFFKAITTIETKKAVISTIRPVLEAWRTTNLADIEDVAVRSDWRIAKRLLGQAIVVLDEDGERFIKSVIEGMAPWDRAVSFKGYIEPATAKLKEDTRRAVTSWLIEGMKRKTSEGITDPVTRPINMVLDRGVRGYGFRWLDNIWAQRLQGASDNIYAKFLGELNISTSEAMQRKMLLKLAFTKRLAERNYLKEVRKFGKKKAAEMARLRSARAEAEAMYGKELGPVLRRLEAADFAIRRRFGTEQLRRAHRVCMPIAAGAGLLDKLGVPYSGEVATVCAIFGANYMLQKLGIVKTFAADIASWQRILNTVISKWEHDSDEGFDLHRVLGTYNETIISMMVQGTAQLGLNFAERTPLGQIIGNVPFLSRIPLAMNSRTFFPLFSGDLGKPDFVMGRGAGWGFGGLMFATGMSMAEIAVITTLTKLDQFMSAHDNYQGWRVSNYGVNGFLVNPAGLMWTAWMSRRDPDADLRDGGRQVIERLLGIGTQYLTLKFWDAYAKRGVWMGKMNRLLGSAVTFRQEATDKETGEVLQKTESAEQAKKAARDAYEVFADRYEYNLFPFGSEFHMDELESWFSEKDEAMKPDMLGRNTKGYLALLAEDKEDIGGDGSGPLKLMEFLKGFEDAVSDPGDEWRTALYPFKRWGRQKALYYMSLIVKTYARKSSSDKKYLPFKESYDRLYEKHPSYWMRIPLCLNEEDIKKEIEKVQETGEVAVTPIGFGAMVTGESGNLKLEEFLMKYLRGDTPQNSSGMDGKSDDDIGDAHGL